MTKIHVRWREPRVHWVLMGAAWTLNTVISAAVHAYNNYLVHQYLTPRTMNVDQLVKDLDGVFTDRLYIPVLLLGVLGMLFIYTVSGFCFIKGLTYREQNQNFTTIMWGGIGTAFLPITQVIFSLDIPFYSWGIIFGFTCWVMVIGMIIAMEGDNDG